MSLSCLSKACCDEETVNCFTSVCDDRVRVDNTIAAVAILENDTFPELGETLALSTGTVVLEECNYAESILQWVRDKQYACEGGGKFYHFLHNGLLAKGTRAKPTQTFSENGSEYFAPKHLRYETTAELMLEEHYLPNTDTVCGIMKRGSSISLAYFFKQGTLVLDNDSSYSAYISDGGFEVTGERNEFIMGSLTITEKGDCEPKFRWAQKPNDFIKALKTPTQFTFGLNTYTGIVEAACGASGNCITLNAVAATPFTITPIVNEAVSCVGYSVTKDCNEAVDFDLVVDADTGVMESVAGLAAGTYKVTQEVANGCCIYGTQCFKLIVA